MGRDRDGQNVARRDATEEKKNKNEDTRVPQAWAPRRPHAHSSARTTRHARHGHELRTRFPGWESPASEIKRKRDGAGRDGMGQDAPEQEKNKEDARIPQALGPRDITRAQHRKLDTSRTQIRNLISKLGAPHSDQRALVARSGVIVGTAPSIPSWKWKWK